MAMEQREVVDLPAVAVVGLSRCKKGTHRGDVTAAGTVSALNSMKTVPDCHGAMPAVADVCI